MAGVKKQDDKESSSSQLRAEAEKKVARSADESATLKKQDMDKLVHELRVHQVELEMQNEELRGAQEQIAKSRNDYADLYDFSPVGYLTFNGDALITGVNLTGAALLGVERQKLLKRRFRQFVAQADADTWDRHFVSVLQQGEKQSCELLLRRNDGSTLHSRLDSIRVEMDHGTFEVRTGMSDITIQKQSVEALKESEEKYHTIADFTRDWEYWLSPEGTFLYVSPSSKFHTGYAPEAFQQDPGLMLEIIHPHDRDIYASHQKEALASDKRSNPLDFRIVTRDGEERWIGHRCQKVYRRDGKYIGIRGSNRDITDRKAAEHAVRERLKELSSLYGITSLAEIQGIPLDELLKRIVMLIPPGYQFPEVAEACIILENQVFATARFHETPWMQASKITVAGKTVGHVKVCYLEERPAGDDGPFLKEERQLIDDIALRLGKIISRVWSEEALRESEEQFRLSLENAPDGVYMNDLEGNFLYGNFKCEEILGYKREELIGKNFLELNILPEDSLARAAEILQDNINGKSTGPDELKLIRKNGQLVPVEINTNIVQRKGQAVVLAFVRDITERKLSEEKLQKSYESLKKALNDAISTMVKIVELRDPYTAGHQQKVAQLATAIAGEMKFDDTQIEQLRMAATVHDIGKIYVPSDILSKPGKLTAIELSLIRTHAQNGYDIVQGMDFPGAVAEAVLQHHERLDGSGYPNHLKGEDMLLEAKILAVADVIEAMAAHRPYRPALGIDKALEEISKNRGKLYDPDVVYTCLGLFNSGRFEFK